MQHVSDRNQYPTTKMTEHGFVIDARAELPGSRCFKRWDRTIILTYGQRNGIDLSFSQRILFHYSCEPKMSLISFETQHLLGRNSETTSVVTLFKLGGTKYLNVRRSPLCSKTYTNNAEPTQEKACCNRGNSPALLQACVATRLCAKNLSSFSGRGQLGEVTSLPRSMRKIIRKAVRGKRLQSVSCIFWIRST